MKTKPDIRGIEEIKQLVDAFYARVQQDELLAPIFNHRLSPYWVPHLEKMYAFWNAALLGEKGYVGNPFAKHATLPVDSDHFERWLTLFNTTVDAHFEGPIAEDAKKRALLMATTFQRRMTDQKDSPGAILV
jgi:hemoglobin